MSRPNGFPGWVPPLIAVGALLSGVAHARDVAVPSSELEPFVGLPADGLLDFGNGPTTRGSALRQSFAADAGESLSFRFNFLTDEPEPASPLDAINHFGFVTLVDEAGGIVLQESLADAIGSTGFPLMSSATRFARESGYQSFEFLLPTAGTYTLAIGVTSVVDDLFESGLLVDSLALSDSMLVNPGFETGDFTGFETIGRARIITASFGSGPDSGGSQALLSTAIPEPSGLVLTALGLAGVAGVGYRRATARRHLPPAP